jgi:hypothetical protein
MTLDALDLAFVARWEARVPGAGPPPDPVAAFTEPQALDIPVPDRPRATLEPAADDDLVGRLLAAAPEQWEALADEIEAARLAGRRVIAITGAERGEGRSTLVSGIGRVLRQRGHEVDIRHRDSLPTASDEATAIGHDRRIVLVDAGRWFPAGPIRRQRLMVASAGCDAAILVRRADREPAPMRAAALAAIGIEVLGEVVTFALPVTAVTGDTP